MEKTLRRDVIYRGRILTLLRDEVELDNGRISSREVILHPGAAAILPVLADGRIVLIRQFRKALEKTIYEIPAGTLEPGENPLACARRELAEETGYRARTLKKLARFYPAPGYTNEVIHIFSARGLIRAAKNLESDEQIETAIFSEREILKLIERGKIQDSKTLIAVASWRGLLG